MQEEATEQDDHAATERVEDREGEWLLVRLRLRLRLRVRLRVGVGVREP